MFGNHHSVVSIAYFGPRFSGVLWVGSDRNAVMGEAAGGAGMVGANGIVDSGPVSYPDAAKWLYSSK